ncbi:MAG: hypothetical protein K2Q01_10160 [Rickettsiales bacterium]|nr:hypothetical protein [Rickettsiales bacterium]
MSTAEKLFQEIEQFISESRQILEEGALMEMQGLDLQVRMLCETVLLLSQAERIAYADRMQSLLGQLKELGEAMTASRDNLSEEIRQLNHQKKAAQAYKTADSRDGFGKRDTDEE